MSMQLILYPQHYNGYSSNFSGGPPLQFLVDGINFTSINTSTASTNAGNVMDVLTAQPPTIVNTWYRSREFAGMSYPTEISSNVVLYSISTFSFSSTYIYQRMSNLIVGQVYKVAVNCQPADADSKIGILVHTPSGGTTYSIGFNILNANIGYIELSFTAQTTEDIVLIWFGSTLDDSITIEDISVTSNIINPPSGVYTNLQDGQVICDLYEEEDIPLTLSMDEFKNVAEQVKSYSKDFNLPATKRNNRIFNNMFEITRSDDGLIFNPQVITKCVLKQDGFILFEGFLRMIDIKDKEGEISYNVNLYSEVIAFADILKDRTFAALDFSELEHSYTITNINNSSESLGVGNGLLLTTALPTTSLAYDSITGVNNTQVLKYPFVDWNHQFTGLVNPTLVNLESAFRPFIQLKYLINKIFAATNQFTYTSAFFDSAEFEKLFMDFNWGGNENGSSPTVIGGNSRYPTSEQLPSGGYNAVQYDNSTSGITTYWSTGLHRFTSPVNNLNFTCIQGKIRAQCTSLTGTITMRFAHYDANNNFIQEWGFHSVSVVIAVVVETVAFFSTVMEAGDYIQAETKLGGGVPYAAFELLSSSKFDMLFTSVGSQTSTLLTETRGELGQWDFLKGIMTMFNLVSTADKDNPNNILIEPYNDIFINNTNSGNTSNLTLAARSIQHDWTDKVDVSQMELNPLTDLDKNTIFKFVEDDDDYLFQVFKSANSGHLYGSRNYDASTSSSGLNTLFTGTEEIVAEPFAASVIAPLESAYMDFVVPRIYSRDEDGLCESFENSPRILYNNGVKTLAVNTYTVPAQNGDTARIQSDFLQFSHLSEIPSVSATSKDFVFTSFQLTSVDVGVPPLDNLFTTYWLHYLTELYHADTRTMTLKVNLTPADIATFKFNDTVMIKNRSFRVNKIEYKPNSLAKVEFILLP